MQISRSCLRYQLKSLLSALFNNSYFQKTSKHTWIEFRRTTREVYSPSRIDFDELIHVLGEDNVDFSVYFFWNYVSNIHPQVQTQDLPSPGWIWCRKIIVFDVAASTLVLHFFFPIPTSKYEKRPSGGRPRWNSTNISVSRVSQRERNRGYPTVHRRP